MVQWGTRISDFVKSLDPSLSSTSDSFQIKYSTTEVVLSSPLFFSRSNAHMIFRDNEFIYFLFFDFHHPYLAHWTTLFSSEVSSNIEWFQLPLNCSYEKSNCDPPY
ncbi:hypothetical protein QL285_023780 [Trifolium repens]|nr:hypothetical protein QL285_023780 [Trifolium repens]